MVPYGLIILILAIAATAPYVDAYLAHRRQAKIEAAKRRHPSYRQKRP